MDDAASAGLLDAAECSYQNLEMKSFPHRRQRTSMVIFSKLIDDIHIGSLGRLAYV